MKPIDYIYKNLDSFNISIFKQIVEDSGETPSEDIYDYLMETTWNTNPALLKQFGLDIERSSEDESIGKIIFEGHPYDCSTDDDGGGVYYFNFSSEFEEGKEYQLVGTYGVCDWDSENFYAKGIIQKTIDIEFSIDENYNFIVSNNEYRISSSDSAILFIPPEENNYLDNLEEAIDNTYITIKEL